MNENGASLADIAELMEELAAYGGQTIVVKIGGNSIAEDPAFLDTVAGQLEFLQSRHVRIVLVHGGGPQIDQALRESGIAPVKGKDGRRVTDPATMAVVRRVMDSLSRQVAEALERQGCAVQSAVGLNACFVRAEPLSNAAGEEDRTGRPVQVDAEGLRTWLDKGEILVLNSVGRGATGLDYNINADDYAMGIAIGLKARRLILATNVPGVYDAQKNPVSLVTPPLAREMMAKGVITGGMIPKIESALNALGAGVGGVAVINAHQPWALLGELLTRRGFGTLITGA